MDKDIKRLDKIGDYTIADLPILENTESTSISEIPLLEELVKSIQGTPYRRDANNDNWCVVYNNVSDYYNVIGNKIAIKIYNQQSHFIPVFNYKFSKSDIDMAIRGFHYLKTVLAYMGNLKIEDKISICGWLSEQIFDCEKMMVINNWK